MDEINLVFLDSEISFKELHKGLRMEHIKVVYIQSNNKHIQFIFNRILLGMIIFLHYFSRTLNNIKFKHSRFNLIISTLAQFDNFPKFILNKRKEIITLKTLICVGLVGIYRFLSVFFR